MQDSSSRTVCTVVSTKPSSGPKRIGRLWRCECPAASYFSLAAGFLTGKYRSEADLAKSPRGQGVKKYLDERGFRILDALDQVAKQTASTPKAVALAWLLARPSVTAPIASATSLAQLDTLIAGSRLPLDPAAVALLDRASA
jgi:aryl-alcohol dehydrogenase-like predicted oxidoreductase